MKIVPDMKGSAQEIFDEIVAQGTVKEGAIAISMATWAALKAKFLGENCSWHETGQNMKQILTAKEGWDWIKCHFTRKWTVWIHLVTGFLLAIICGWYPVPALVAFAAFGFFEWWQAEVEGDLGHMDFFDALVAFIIGLGILWILKLAGVI